MIEANKKYRSSAKKQKIQRKTKWKLRTKNTITEIKNSEDYMKSRMEGTEKRRRKRMIEQQDLLNLNINKDKTH